VTKEEARELLGLYVDKLNEFGRELPIFDEVITVINTNSTAEQQCKFELLDPFIDYSFRGLMKIAYDLKDA